MFRKLINIVSHPSLLGIYFIDRWQTVLCWFISFFMVGTAFLAAYHLNTEEFTPTFINETTEVMLKTGKIDDSIYQDGKLSGNTRTINFESMIIYFNDNAYINDKAYLGLIVVFGKESVKMYYAKNLIGDLAYSNLSIKGFKLEDVLAGNILEKMKFESFVMSAFKSGEMNYRAICFFDSFLDMVMLYIFTLIICYVAGWLFNPSIDSKFRIRLATYDSLIYFLFYIPHLMFRTYWLFPAGIVVAFIYTILTFIHIRKVEVRRRRIK